MGKESERVLAWVEDDTSWALRGRRACLCIPTLRLLFDSVCVFLDDDSHRGPHEADIIDQTRDRNACTRLHEARPPKHHTPCQSHAFPDQYRRER